jgi:hypothetical protein
MVPTGHQHQETRTLLISRAIQSLGMGGRMRKELALTSVIV